MSGAQSGLGLGTYGNQLALMDPAQAAAVRRQMYAQQLLGQAGEVTPLRSPWQAAARAVQGLLGGYEMGQGQQALEQYALGSRQALSDIYAGMPLPGVAAASAAAASGAPASAPTTTAPRSPTPTGTPLPPPSFDPHYDKATASSGIPRGVLVAKDAAESNFDPNAVSSTGAVGVGQVLPSTAKTPGYGMSPIDTADLTDPGKNIPWSANYLAARGKSIFGDAWDPTNPNQLRTALVAYRGNTPDAGAYADKILAQSGLTAGTAGGDGSYKVAAAETGSQTDIAPGPGAPPSAGAAPPAQAGRPAPDPALAYGQQIYQQYRSMAAEAAKSPYAAVRAMAPQFMQQAVGALQYGRWQISRDPQTQQVMAYDRFGQEAPKAIGAEPKYMTTQSGDIINPATGQPVSAGYMTTLTTLAPKIQNGTATAQEQAQYNAAFSAAGFKPEWKLDPTDGQYKLFPPTGIPPNLPMPPGFTGRPETSGYTASAATPAQPYGGAGGARMPAPNVALAKQNGVPVMPGTPYVGMTPVEAQKAATEDRQKATAALAESDKEVEAQKVQIQQAKRLMELNKDIPSGSDWASRAAQYVAIHGANDPKLQEFNQLSSSLVPGMRTGTGINRVTNKDMGIFERMVPGVDNSPEANAQIANAAISKAQTAIAYNRFQHDYLEANGSLMGVESAWDTYSNANPIFTQDRNGNAILNPNAVDRRTWFKQNTDPQTGQLAIGGGQQPQQSGQMPPPAAIARLQEGQATRFNNGQTWTLRNGQPVQVQ